MDERFSRTEALLGADAMQALNAARVAVFGVGGVGGHAADALARSGVGAIDLIDPDTVSITNINRQLVALGSTVGRYKVDVMRERILDIAPAARVTAHKLFYSEETASAFDLASYDYIIDAIDTVSSKLLLITSAEALGVPVISSMGTGNKLDPTALEIADIYKTSVCPLARVMRTELRRRGVKHLKVLYSRELPRRVTVNDGAAHPSRHAPASVAFVPAAAGLIIAAEVIKDIAYGSAPDHSVPQRC